MASIAKRPDGSYRARYRDDAGKEHARHFKRKIDAQRWLDEVTASIVTGQYVAPKAGRITFREYANAWLDAQVNRESTETTYRGHLNRHVYPVIGDLPLEKILTSTVQGLIKGMSIDSDDRSALAPATIETVYKVVASVFRAAVRDRKIARTPCDGINLPEVHKTRVQPLAASQLDVLAENLPERLRALVILGAGTGVRQGEALGLTRDRLRLLGKDPMITIDRQLVTRAGGTTVFAPPKTASSVRTIPLPKVVVNALNEHIAAFDIGAHDLLFTWQGQGITRQRFGHLWRPAAAAAGLTDATGTGMHALRHYYASLLIRYGESVKTVQDRLGHKSATETLDTYSHLWADSDDRTRAAVDSVLLDRSADVGDSADLVRTTGGEA